MPKPEPDGVIEYRTVCASNLGCEIEVVGSKGDVYVLRWGKDPQGFTQMAWICTCKGYQHRYTCRHQGEAQAKACFAGREAYNGDQGLDRAATECPKCGGPVTSIKVAV